jgi:DNA polymerase elongation subunit (family B)
LERRIAEEEFVVSQTLSRELDEYRVPSPVARAARQLQLAGRNVRMGQRIQFVHAATRDGVQAWDLRIDTARYKELLFRAIREVLQPIGVPEEGLRNWVFRRASYLERGGLLPARIETPLFAGIKRLRGGAA